MRPALFLVALGVLRLRLRAPRRAAPLLWTRSSRVDRSSLVLIALLALGALTACGRAAPVVAPATPRVLDVAAVVPAGAGEEEVALEILELMCSPCADQIVHGSRDLPGVTFVTMQLNTKTLTVRYDPAVTDRERVVAGVDTIVASIR